MMTENATHFVGPLTFAGLSGQPPLTDTFEDAMAHIHWAKWADVACVTPMSANFLAKLATGIADDLPSTTLLAIPLTVPVILAPAMNTVMWNHPVVQRNLKWVADLNRYQIVPPVSKRLACGDEGIGGLAEPSAILRCCEQAILNHG